MAQNWIDRMKIAVDYAGDWFTLAPKYRTKAQLSEHIFRAMEELGKDSSPTGDPECSICHRPVFQGEPHNHPCE